jgi:hypothetical protein
MNKEREALLKEILAQPDVPHKVSERSILRLLGRMKPQTKEMRDYIVAYFSSETRAQAHAFKKDYFAKLSPLQAKEFDAAFVQCLFNDVGLSDTSTAEVENSAFAPSV